MGEKIKQPKLFTILLCVAIFLLSAGIITIIVGAILLSTGDYDVHILAPATMVPGGLAIYFSLLCFIWGFMPKLEKAMIEKAKYVQQITKQSQTEIATTQAEISHKALKQTAKAIKEGLKDTKFCKECGKEIDADAKFCKECGTKQ